MVGVNDTFTVRQVDAWVAALARTFARERDALGALDAVVGDGDHGATMERAFAAAHDALRRSPPSEGDPDGDDVSARLSSVARAVMASAGGASGPLTSSVFVALAGAARRRDGLDASAMAAGLRDAADLVARMGRSQPGDKTLLDALAPAAAACNLLVDERPDATVAQALRVAADAAASGRDSTTGMHGRRGRAAWVEGGGVGHADPGATSCAWILRTGAEVAERSIADPLGGWEDVASGASVHGASVHGRAPVDDASAEARPSHGAPAGKLLNDPFDAVEEMIEGFVATYPSKVRRLGDRNVVLRARAKAPGQVAMVIGNGSGHEPIAIGWVGRGMLDANAVGPIFTAPGPDLIADAIAAADTGAGVLLLISHHEGDRIAGELAAQLARQAGHDVRTLTMYDDVASAPKGREHERRGAPGTAFVYKIVGAALEEGVTLHDAVRLGERVRDATRTLSVAVAPGTSPLTGAPMFELPPGEAFIGMGVHGEPGFARMPAGNVDAIVDRIVDGLVEDGDFRRGDRLLTFLNGAGGTSTMELWVAMRAVHRRAVRAGFTLHRPLVGSFVTTQEMHGMSLSFCRADDDMIRLWDAPCDVPSFPSHGGSAS